MKKNAESEEALFCSVCGLYLNSAQQLKSHMKSTKHKMVELGLIDKKSEQTKKRDIVSNAYRAEFTLLTQMAKIQL